MPNSYPCDGIFSRHLTTLKDSYILQLERRQYYTAGLEAIIYSWMGDNFLQSGLQRVFYNWPGDIDLLLDSGQCSTAGQEKCSIARQETQFHSWSRVSSPQLDWRHSSAALQQSVFYSLTGNTILQLDRRLFYS